MRRAGLASCLQRCPTLPAVAEFIQGIRISFSFPLLRLALPVGPPLEDELDDHMNSVDMDVTDEEVNRMTKWRDGAPETPATARHRPPISGFLRAVPEAVGERRLAGLPAARRDGPCCGRRGGLLWWGGGLKGDPSPWQAAPRLAQHGTTECLAA